MSSKTEKIEAKNNIKQILNDRGFEAVTPTEKILTGLNITIHRFNKIIDNKVVLTANELFYFSKWLKVPVSSILQYQDEVNDTVETAFSK